ncbi:unnamed protein product [Phytophthora fragariaefolia]|uniref:Unnamed protein product n=1 Tax=Phytophthora fragariaefolia TaxID=1490495 RepID=A0A9W6XVA3_9STRA|nr:unnamed protein product [Phytophthora fragariaefolia]
MFRACASAPVFEMQQDSSESYTSTRGSSHSDITLLEGETKVPHAPLEIHSAWTPPELSTSNGAFSPTSQEATLKPSLHLVLGYRP